MVATVVSGRVLDPAGRPVGGARVLVTASPGPVPDIGQVTAGDGRFAAAAPRPGAYRIAVHADGRAAVEVPVHVAAHGPAPELTIILGAAGGC